MDLVGFPFLRKPWYPILIPDRDNDIEGIVELTFSVDDEKFGERRTIDLIPGGEEINVTNENKPQYIE